MIEMTTPWQKVITYYYLVQDFNLSKIMTCVSDTHPPQLSSLQHMYSFFFAQNWTPTAHLDIYLATNLTQDLWIR